MPAPLIEFPADDPGRARRFWYGVLGAELARRPAEAGAGWEIEDDGLRLGIHERGPGPGDRACLPYFTVADLAAALNGVRELGGSVIHPGERWAVCRDSEGNPFALAAAPRPVCFHRPSDLINNRGLIADPEAFARDADAASWLFLCGEEFAAMDGGMSYADVQAVVPESVNVVSDPPAELDMDLARQHVAALDQLPRPTLVTCRTGPRSSAVIYLYAGLRAGAGADEVLARAEADGAPFTGSDELKAWVARGLDELA
jgi:predicted enzyme related to lactoylglutathione lyase